MSDNHEHYSKKWERGVAAVLAEQSILQSVIDESMRRGDLLDAGIASYEHGLASFQLGDTKEGGAGLAIGIMLIHANMFGAPEDISEDQVSIKMPNALSNVPTMWRFQAYPDRDKEIQSQTAIDEIAVHLLEAETLLNDEVATTSAKNHAVHDAVKAVADFHFSNMPLVPNFYFSDMPHPARSEEIVTFIKQLAEHIEVEEDLTSQRLAYDTYRRLMLSAFHAGSVKTTAALNVAARGFNELAEYTADPGSRADCKQLVKEIREAQLSQLAFVPVALTRNAIATSDQRLRPGHNSDTPHPRIRAPKKIKQNAQTDYERIPRESTLG